VPGRDHALDDVLNVRNGGRAIHANPLVCANDPGPVRGGPRSTQCRSPNPLSARPTSGASARPDSPYCSHALSFRPRRHITHVVIRRGVAWRNLGSGARRSEISRLHSASYAMGGAWAIPLEMTRKGVRLLARLWTSTCSRHRSGAKSAVPKVTLWAETRDRHPYHVPAVEDPWSLAGQHRTDRYDASLLQGIAGRRPFRIARPRGRRGGGRWRSRTTYPAR
jgi:hypothetical protein